MGGVAFVEDAGHDQDPLMLVMWPVTPLALSLLKWKLSSVTLPSSCELTTHHPEASVGNLPSMSSSWHQK